MSKKYLAKTLEAMVKENVDDAKKAFSMYVDSKFKKLVNEADNAVSLNVRSDYTKHYAKQYNKHTNSKTAEAEAYAHVEQKHGKSKAGALKQYHANNLKDSESDEEAEDESKE